MADPEIIRTSFDPNGHTFPVVWQPDTGDLAVHPCTHCGGQDPRIDCPIDSDDLRPKPAS